MNILRNHLGNTFGVDIDDAFIERRIRIAQVHVRVGLDIRHYVAAMQVLVNAIVEVTQKAGYDSGDILAIVKTSTKLLNFEMQLILHFYELQTKEEKQSTNQRVGDML